MWAGLAHSQQNGKTLGRPVTAALFSKFEIAIRLPVGRTSVRRILAAYSPRNRSPHSSTQACRKLTKLRYDGRWTTTSNIITLNATIKARAIFSSSLLQINRYAPSAGPFAVATGSAACLSSTPEPL